MLNAINSLKANGGTDYNKGLINQMAGSLLISKNGKYKKVIVYLTDGLPNSEPNVTNIINEAKLQNCSIYSVVVGISCPQSLKDISSQTGGKWYEDIYTDEEMNKVYQEILRIAQGSEPCEITWESGVSCFAGMIKVELNHLQKGTIATTIYQSANKLVAKLEFEPSSLKFIDPQVGVKVEQKVTVTARNANFTVTNITSNNGGFEITPKSFVLNSGQSLELTVSYLPVDSGYNFCRFDIENDNCSTKYLTSGGWKGKKPKVKTLKIIHPNGGEVFVAGSDTIITWEGVGPDEPVKIEYRIDDNKPWMKIVDSAKGLSYKWRVPKTPSNKCLARVISDVKNGGLFDNQLVLIPSGSFEMGNTGNWDIGWDNEVPHKVTISRSFLMSKYEITQKQYFEVMDTIIGTHFKRENLPVADVSWLDAIKFCNLLSELNGFEKCYSGSGTNIVCDWNANGYRLPTEAEWEYACKAGTTTDFYNGKLNYKDCKPIDTTLDRIAWYCGNDVFIKSDVGSKEPNRFGLYDMSGGVHEWCWDAYVDYDTSQQIDPKGLKDFFKNRVKRGGSYDSESYRCRSSIRESEYYTNRIYDVGFRIVRYK